MTATTLLLADDHPITRYSVAACLASVQDIWVIGEAADGHEALCLAEALRPDVLLELSLPMAVACTVLRSVTF